jgi:ligand-binding sensor domain-containing protein/HPt (histidine-containing phosphotransfer) domain-containing protein
MKHTNVSDRIFRGHQFSVISDVLARLLASIVGACVFFVSSTVFADSLPQRINFQHLLEDKDIALGQVNAFQEDQKGFMWIGGQGGLIRYDGYEFVFMLQTIMKDGEYVKEPIKNVNHIYEDPNNILWVATRTGILRYDPRRELLEPVADDPKQPHKITTSNTYRFVSLPTGELLVASGSGLLILNPETLAYELIIPDSTKTDWLNSLGVNVVFIDRSGIIWLGTGAGLEKLEWETKKFTLIKPYPEDPNFTQANAVTAITQDRDGSLWVGTSNGLVNYNPETLARKRYINDVNDPNSIAGTEIAKVMIDSNGALWVASDGGGIAIFEKNDRYPQGRFINHKYEPGRASSLNSNQVRTVYEDRNGDVWVGNYPGGINYFNRASAGITSFTHDQSDKASISHSAVLAVREDHLGNFWVGTDGGGLNYFDRENEEFSSFQNDPNNPNTLSGNAVLDVLVAKDGKIWVGTWAGGVSILDPSSGTVTRLPFEVANPKKSAISTSDRLYDATVWHFREDKDNNLWIGTHNAGLSKLDPKTGIYTHYTTIFGDPSSITNGVVWTTFEDSQGNFWVGTATGLDLMDRKSGTFKHYLPDPNNPNGLRNPAVLSIHEDRKNRLWIGTEGGLHLMDREQGTFTAYTKVDGFNDDTIRTMLEAPDGKLWLATNNGVSVFDAETKKVRNYNRDSGKLMGSFHTDSGLISRKGEIFFGGVEGLRIFDPERLKENQVVPAIAFTELKIFADTISVGGDDGLLPTSLNYSQKIVLDYQKTMFQLGFAALNFRDSNKNNYAYMLEGFDNEWLEVADQRSAKYTNLNPGTYVFRVRGSNNDGVWNDQGASITIVQLPPPWRTWWAYSLYGLTILGSILLFVHSQRKKRRLVEEQNRLLEIKVAERTLELREKNNDIKSMLSNMRQGLFTIEPTGNIHPEYSLYLEEIFETDHLAGKKALTVLFEGAQLGSNAIDQVKEAVFTMIGEDEMNYDFNAHLLITDYEVDFHGTSKYLELDWNPIIVDKLIVKLMVSVRDVTLLKQMEADARTKKRELDIIGQLLNISAKKYVGFVAATQRFIAENRAQIEASPERSDSVLALLFRNMHTIKGNCRTFDFNYFSDVVHDVESAYSRLKSNKEMPWDQSLLLADLGRVETVLAEYERIYYGVLGRGDSTARDANGYWADTKDIENIQHLVAVADEHPELTQALPLLPIRELLNRALTNPISEVLADVVDSLPSIALQLGKAKPNVVINDNDVRIKTCANELMTNIFAHILRNSVDHGIELPDQRTRAGKPVSGTIEVTAAVNQHTLIICIKDDGQGVNLDRLFRKGVDIGKWNADAKPSSLDIANLIFTSGVSTKEQVSDISGRGVGMDAVKEFLKAQGGDIHIHLLDASLQEKAIGQGAMAPFELIVEFPPNTFLDAA